jgi:hypothetical protein
MTEARPSSGDNDRDDAPSTPGNAQGVPVPHEEAVEGSSQQTEAVDGVFTYPRTSQQEP